MAGLQTAADIPVHVRCENSSSERRINPSWSLAKFKSRLEPITGIPSDCQRLSLTTGAASARDSSVGGAVPIQAGNNEESTLLASFNIPSHSEIYVHDTRPPALRPNLNADTSSVEKYAMPQSQYENLTDSVLAWKRKNQLGRFDPSAPDTLSQLEAKSRREADERGIIVGKRCRLLAAPSPVGTTEVEVEDDRRGEVRYVDTVDKIPATGIWIGVELDEPTGKNDGSVKGTRYFDCKPSHGVFVRPERVEVGDFPVLDELGEDMEEL